MARRLLVIALLATAGCLDDPLDTGHSQSERNVKANAEKDAIARARLDKGVVAPSTPLGELKDFDVVADAGTTVKQSAEVKDAPEQARILVQPDGAPLVKAWRDAKAGDFVTLQCAHFVNKFGNRVRRRVQLRLEIADADALSVKLRVRGNGVEEHDSTNPQTKRKQWSAKFQAGAELVMQRAPDDKLGAPLPARNLNEPVAKVIPLGAQKVEARCAQSKGAEVERTDRCIAAETARLYLTAGLLSEVGELSSNGCKVTGFGNVAPAPHLPSDVDSTHYAFTERGEAKFRERTLSAAGGLVRVELQRLTYLRRKEAGSINWSGKNYAPGVADTRKLHVLDWALEHVMPEYPQQLATN